MHALHSFIMQLLPGCKLWFRLSADKTGISVYILGIKDKTYLAKTYGEKLGRANVSGYCIKFKTVKDINLDILAAAIGYGVQHVKPS